MIKLKQIKAALYVFIMNNIFKIILKKTKTYKKYFFSSRKKKQFKIYIFVAPNKISFSLSGGELFKT